MNIGDIFGISEYDTALNECGALKAIIKEISSEGGFRRFKLIKNPDFSDLELYTTEKHKLEDWFDFYYAQHEQKYRRLMTLGINTDDGKDPNLCLILLYNDAETNRKRIQELEILISECKDEEDC